MEIYVQDLMTTSGVKFGTSGARGLSDDMSDFVCYVYTKGFLQYLEAAGDLKKDGGDVAIAGDYRPSTDLIMEAVRRAVADMGYMPIMCGKIPSPAVALFGLEKKAPAIMVTGSHIPENRNGIKFNKSAGEILKKDEEGIREQFVSVDDELFDKSIMFAQITDDQPAVNNRAREQYIARYLEFFPGDCLKGKKIGIYQHSAVGRDILVDIVKGLGADVVTLGWSDAFIPVDTEAIRPEDVELAANWAAEGAYDTIISTDGDSDRPLISDEYGTWLRGDVAGILCAKYLGADSVCTPVSCNSAVEKCGYFSEVRRTRIGSPFVIASMIEASQSGAKKVVGYEANGGFLTNSDLKHKGKNLRALPTRDAVILHLSIMLLAAQEGKTISELVKDLPQRYTASNRLKNFPQEESKAILDRFSTGDASQDKALAEDTFGDLCGSLDFIDRTDGVRMTFSSGEIVHLRPSGNAPEFRCYNESSSVDRVTDLNAKCMAKLELLKKNGT